MSILVRPVREQLEHDRLIRFLLLNKYKKRFEATGNPGDERVISVKVGSVTLFPDIVLTEGKKVAGLVEVETGESVNNLEALAEWVHFAKARAAFYLYVPVPSVDAARRLCEVNLVQPTEIWSYRGTLDGFDLVRVQHNPNAGGTGRAEAVLTLAKAPVKGPAISAPAESSEPKAEAGTQAKTGTANGVAKQPKKPVKAAAKPAPKAKAPKPAKRPAPVRKSGKKKPAKSNKKKR